MLAPRALVLRAPGTNCDHETAFAFERAGGLARRMHVRALAEKPAAADDFQILCIPGGFSYGDDIASGRIFALEIRTRLADALVVTERIRKAIETADFTEVQPGLKVTTSIGVTAYAAQETLDDVLGRADGFLYQAKQGGRNRVVHGEASASAVTA